MLTVTQLQNVTKKNIDKVSIKEKVILADYNFACQCSI